MTDTTPAPSIHTSGAQLLQTRTFRVELDNHAPARDFTEDTLETWEWPDGHTSLRIPAGWNRVKDWNKAIYLIDDGDTVTVHYVGSFHPTDGAVNLRPFPVNPGGTQQRPDGRGPIDYSLWFHGPRRAYHLKIQKG